MRHKVYENLHITTTCLVHLEVGQVRLNPPLLIHIVNHLKKMQARSLQQDKPLKREAYS